MNDQAFSGQPFRRLIWLLPVAFALHIAEEYLGGFPAWVTNVVGGSFNNLAFAINNAVFMTLMLTLTAWTSKSGSRRSAFLLIVWASGNIFWDGLFHVLMTAAKDRFSPGLITSSILYMPISLVVGWSCVQSRTLSVAAFIGAALCGLALFAFVVWYGLFHFALP
jgi:hypothetical protein